MQYSQLSKIAQFLFINDLNPAMSAPSDEILLAYIDAELEHKNAKELFPQIHKLLQDSKEWRLEYEELKSLIAVEYDDVPNQTLNLDLSYLGTNIKREVDADSVFKRLNDVGGLLISLSEEFLQLQGNIFPQLSFAKSSEGWEPKTLFEISSDDIFDEVKVTVTATETQNYPEQCEVVVNVDILSRGGWPDLEGTNVIVKHAENMLGSKETDAFGDVVFQRIKKRDVSELVFAIYPRAEADI